MKCACGWNGALCLQTCSTPMPQPWPMETGHGVDFTTLIEYHKQQILAAALIPGGAA